VGDVEGGKCIVPLSLASPLDILKYVFRQTDKAALLREKRREKKRRGMKRETGGSVVKHVGTRPFRGCSQGF
jgi:hypothetical protein